MNGSITNTQLTGDVRDRLSTCLSESDGFLFEFSRLGFLNLCHVDPFPDLLEYTSALKTLSIRGRVSSRESRLHSKTVAETPNAAAS